MPSINKIFLGAAESTSASATIALGKKLAQVLQPGDILALAGDLGAGKTIFVKGISAGLEIAPEEISSPTFAIIEEHRTARTALCHADLYRLSLEEEALECGIAQYWQDNKEWIVAIEWPQRLGALLPQRALEIRIFWQAEKTTSKKRSDTKEIVQFFSAADIAFRLPRRIEFWGESKWKKRLKKIPLAQK